METGVVVEKENITDHEAGSGSLYVPILADLLPDLFDHQMKAVYRWFVIARVNGELYRYEVEEEVYNQLKEGDQIEIKTDKYGMPDVVPLTMSCTAVGLHYILI